jgi:hypothetical protein
MRNVDAARRGIDRDVVEVLVLGALRRAEAVFLKQLVAVGGRGRERQSSNRITYPPPKKCLRPLVFMRSLLRDSQHF